MNDKALVLIWKGQELPKELLDGIISILINSKICIPEMLQATYMNEDDVAKALAANIIAARNAIKIAVEDNNLNETIKNAVIYISKRFEASLSDPNRDLTLFAMDLTTAYIAEKHRGAFPGVGYGFELAKAVETIATHTGTIPSAVAKEYHFSQRVCDIIKKVYYSY